MKYVYAAYRNSDMTEGRGPMVLDKVFEFEEDCNNYIDKKPGIMGRKLKWSREEFGDWETRKFTVYSSIEEACEGESNV